MVSIPVGYSLLIIPINMLCNYLLTIIKGVNMLEEPTIIPPLAIIRLIKTIFKSRQEEQVFDKDWLLNNLRIDKDEYDYLINRASPEEVSILHHRPRDYSEYKRIVEIKHKYLLLYRYDLSRTYNNILRRGNNTTVRD